MAYKRNNLNYGLSITDTGTTAGYAGGDTYGTLYCRDVQFGEVRHAEFENQFIYIWEETESIKELYKELNGLLENEIKFKIPRCVCKMLRNSTYVELFDVPTITELKKYKVYINKENKIVQEFQGVVDRWFYSPDKVHNPLQGLSNIQDGEECLLRADKATAYVIFNDDLKRNRFLSMLSAETNRTKMKKTLGIWFIPHNIPVLRIFHNSIDEKVKGVYQFNKIAKVLNVDAPQPNRNIITVTQKLTQMEKKEGVSYRYEICTRVAPLEKNSLLKSINIKLQSSQSIAIAAVDMTCEMTVNRELAEEDNIYIKASFLAQDPEKKSIEQPYLVKPYKYSLYDLLRKAMLTIDTQIIDTTKHGLDPIYNEQNKDIGIQYPLVIDNYWEIKLKQTMVNDSIFENRNFLEILLQIGKYLHATPKLRFASDGTDRYELYFLQLGGTEEKNNDSNKLTVYNSKALSEYYTQFDSYVQNLFSSQNSVTEYLVPKTSDASYLVSNNTAELQTKYNILEIIAFEISMDGQEYKSAIDYIFEKSVYDTLPSNANITPSKGNSLYYTLGSNKIVGLDYMAEKAVGVNLTSLKIICRKVFGIENVDKLNYNQLSFKLTYRTQDSLRLTQFKPNLSDFMKDNAYESYPHNEQFYQQQDKIIDSEKFSGNLWGQLIKSANEKYTCNEYCTPLTEKVVGKLVLIDNEVYYVTAIDTEYYNEAILQKVQYSKNFNNFSAVTSIPCEPRFYEISERSSIRRETRQFEFFELTDSIENYKESNARYVKDWQEYLKKLIFCENGNAEIPNYVYVKFMADKFRQHLNSSGTNLEASKLFPSCEQEKENKDGIYQNMPSADGRGVIVPVLQYPLKNSILFEWDMEDNFKAGDAVNPDTSGASGTNKDACYRMQSARYCDVFGGADLMQFTMFKKDNFIREQQQRLPFAEEKNGDGQADFIPTEDERIFGVGGKYAIGLDKDNREAISGNFQIVLLNKAKDNRNGFVLINTVFNKKNARLKLALYKDTVPIIPQALDMSADKLVKENAIYTLNSTNGHIEIAMPLEIVEQKNATVIENIQEVDTTITREELSQVKALVWYDEKNKTKIPYIVKNLATVPDAEKLNPLYIISIYGKE